MRYKLPLKRTFFNPVLQASGSTNIDGKGWWYHRLTKPFGGSWAGTCFVAKTVTWKPRQGNMPLKTDGKTPRELLPKCIHVNRNTGAAVNAVGLSNPGLEFVLKQGWWDKRPEPFMVSIMSVAATAEERIGEIRECADLLERWIAWEGLREHIAVQLNLSCPNCGHDPKEFVSEAAAMLDRLGKLDVPIVPKLGPDFTVPMAEEIAKHPACDALCVFNTLPWDKLPEKERMQYFGTTVSPLEKHFGEKGRGGVSGAPLFPRLCSWLEEAKNASLGVPIIAGGGILCPRDARKIVSLGAAAVSLGSMGFLAFSALQETVLEAQAALDERFGYSDSDE